MSGLVLYEFALDDDCYRVRLLLGLLGLPVARRAVDVLPGTEHMQPPFLALNPLGTLPVLTDGDLVLRDAGAILAYLAQRYDAGRTWLPEAPAAFGAVMMWLGFAARQSRPATAARLHALFDQPSGPGDLAAARDAFRAMDDHMTAREFYDAHWFAADGPTVADVALFPAIALSRDSGIEHGDYPALRRWMRRVRGLAGFVAMPGIPDHH